MVVTDDDRMRMEFFQQEIFDILFGAHFREGCRERHDHQVPDLLPGQELYLFFQGIEQPDFGRSAPHDLAGMWIKGDYYCLAVDPGGFLPQLLQDLRVTDMNSIESAYRNDRPSESRQLIGMIIYLHVELNG
jgi:hypothetical protein